MYDAADSILAQKLSQVEGVGQVIVGGGAKPAVRVELNPRALESFQIGLDQVRTTLANANANSPKGASARGQRTLGDCDHRPALPSGRLRPLIVSYHNGAAVRLARRGGRGRFRAGPPQRRASPTASRPC